MGMMILLIGFVWDAVGLHPASSTIAGEQNFTASIS
jgi:hypothetical protein